MIHKNKLKLHLQLITYYNNYEYYYYNYQPQLLYLLEELCMNRWI